MAFGLQVKKHLYNTSTEVKTILDFRPMLGWRLCVYILIVLHIETWLISSTRTFIIGPLKYTSIITPLALSVSRICVPQVIVYV